MGLLHIIAFLLSFFVIECLPSDKPVVWSVTNEMKVGGVKHDHPWIGIDYINQQMIYTYSTAGLALVSFSEGTMVESTVGNSGTWSDPGWSTSKPLFFDNAVDLNMTGSSTAFKESILYLYDDLIALALRDRLQFCGLRKGEIVPIYGIENPCGKDSNHPVSLEFGAERLIVASNSSFCVFERQVVTLPAELELQKKPLDDWFEHHIGSQASQNVPGALPAPTKFKLLRAYNTETGVTDANVLPHMGAPHEITSVLVQMRNKDFKELVIFTENVKYEKNSISVDYLTGFREHPSNIFESVQALGPIIGAIVDGKIEIWKEREFNALEFSPGENRWSKSTIASSMDMTALDFTSSPDGTNIVLAAIYNKTDVWIYSMPIFNEAAIPSWEPEFILKAEEFYHGKNPLIELGLEPSLEGTGMEPWKDSELTSIAIGRTSSGWDHYSIGVFSEHPNGGIGEIPDGGSIPPKGQYSMVKTLVRSTCIPETIKQATGETEPRSAVVYQSIPEQSMDSCASMCNHAEECRMVSWENGVCDFANQTVPITQLSDMCGEYTNWVYKNPNPDVLVANPYTVVTTYYDNGTEMLNYTNYSNLSYVPSGLNDTYNSTIIWQPRSYTFTYMKVADAPQAISFVDGDLDSNELGGEIPVTFGGTFASFGQIWLIGYDMKDVGEDGHWNNTVPQELRYPLCLKQNHLDDAVNPVVNPGKAKLDTKGGSFAEKLMSSNYNIDLDTQNPDSNNYVDPLYDPKKQLYLTLIENVRFTDIPLAGEIANSSSQCFIPIKYLSEKDKYELILEANTKKNVTRIEFRTVLVENNATVVLSPLHVWDTNRGFAPNVNPAKGKMESWDVEAMSHYTASPFFNITSTSSNDNYNPASPPQTTITFASDIVRSTVKIVDHYLDWTGLTYTDTNPICSLLGGTLLWGYTSNILNPQGNAITVGSTNDVDPDGPQTSPLLHFSLYLNTYEEDELTYVTTRGSPVLAFTYLPTDEDKYQKWSIFAVTKLGAHTHKNLTKVLFDLGYQPKITNIRFPDADGRVAKLGGCVVWDVVPTNTTCLTHHEIWFQGPPSPWGDNTVDTTIPNKYLQYLGSVPINETTFPIPKDTPMPVPNTVSMWYVVLKSGFVSKALQDGLILQSSDIPNGIAIPDPTSANSGSSLYKATVHNEAKYVFSIPTVPSNAANIPASYGVNGLDWPKSFAVDLVISDRDKDLFEDSIETYPFPTANMSVDYQQIMNSGIGLEYWFSMLSAGTTQDLMTQVLLSRKFLRSHTTPKYSDEDETASPPIVLNLQTDQCIVGAMIDKPLCWSHAHAKHLQYYMAPPNERRIECAVNMGGLNTIIYDAMYTCRSCAMELLQAEDGNPVGRAACAVSERSKCSSRQISFTVTKALVSVD